MSKNYALSIADKLNIFVGDEKKRIFLSKLSIEIDVNSFCSSGGNKVFGVSKVIINNDENVKKIERLAILEVSSS